MRAQFNPPRFRNFTHVGEILSTDRGERDIWYTIKEDVTGSVFTLPWYSVQVVK